MAVMDGAIANVALPTIARDLHTDPALSIWVVNGYQLAITISLLPLAALGDIVGYRRVYLAGWCCSPRVACSARSRTPCRCWRWRAWCKGFGAAGIMSVNTALHALHLSAAPARPRHRHQRAGGGGLGRGGPDGRRRDPVGRRHGRGCSRSMCPSESRRVVIGPCAPAAHAARHTPSTIRARC